MKKIMINLKDWFNLKENETYINCVNSLPIVVFPALPYLYIYKDADCEIGSQLISTFDKGAHTGNISIEHLKDFNIKWSLINHKELKTQNNDELLEKINISTANNLSTIVCFENLNELTILTNIVKRIKNKERIYFAYEPINKFDINKLKLIIAKIKNKISSDNISLIFGGNISEDNIELYNKELDVDGFLISRHALSPEELKSIINIVEE